MYLSLLWQILYIFIFYQLSSGLRLSNSSDGTNFTHWSEDDWLETRFPIPINNKFQFNRHRYEHLIIRTRMNEWSFELSYGNRSHLSKLWTELHLFFDHRYRSTNLNNSIPGHIRNECDLWGISPITNDSSAFIPELPVMDQHIANYFINDGFFRTINYISCIIDERRRNPPIHIQMNISFVTNREFQSLLYIEMSNTTQKLFSDYQARFYLHNNEVNFKYHFNASDIDYPLNSNTSLVRMIKLYKQMTDASSNSMIISFNMIIILFNFFYFWIVLCS